MIHNSVNSTFCLLQKHKLTKSMLSLCTPAGNVPSNKCPPGFVSAGSCPFPFGECAVGFCYHRPENIYLNGEPGECCFRRK